ncbi:extracellular solute-binding protein [Psychromarinibacter halotolerans]|uniref:Extracellular solute-binding protein n=1 Tax=Psychromarinibacter halotolerans TaxID=1775175 RepID=A0ABV7GS11_9RHOB|nr:extracellular solute-binding protein [Psychromarinibacter halotolerans]MDF0597380.1 extracellular solute-binding protein [Psychromarinibacter halotolerans]
MKKTLMTMSVAMAALVAGAANAQTLYVAGNGGSQEELMKSVIFPMFTEETGVEIVYSAGNSAAVLAKLLAGQDNQQTDIAMMNTGPMSQAIELGLCRDLDISEHEENIHDFAKFDNGKAVGFGVVGLGVAYATEVFAENGWDAPTSWTALEDDTFADKMVFQPLNNTNGMLALIKISEIYGGGVNDMDPGFAKMEETIAPNVLSFEPSSARLAEMYQNGEVYISVWSSTQVKVLAEKGFPIELVYPEEGAMIISNDVCAVTTEEMKPEAIEFVNFLISPEIQEILAKNLGFGPTNALAELTEEEAQGVPYGEDAVSKLQAIDWNIVNASREDWDRRWVREIER